MWEVSERLLVVIDDVLRRYGMSQSEFERRCALSAVVSNIRNGKVMPSTITVCKILKTFSAYSADWVLFGTGQMLRSEGVEVAQRKEIDRLLKINALLQERLMRYEGK